MANDSCLHNETSSSVESSLITSHDQLECRNACLVLAPSFDPARLPHNARSLDAKEGNPWGFGFSDAGWGDPGGVGFSDAGWGDPGGVGSLYARGDSPWGLGFLDTKGGIPGGWAPYMPRKATPEEYCTFKRGGFQYSEIMRHSACKFLALGMLMCCLPRTRGNECCDAVWDYVDDAFEMVCYDKKLADESFCCGIGPCQDKINCCNCEGGCRRPIIVEPPPEPQVLICCRKVNQRLRDRKK
ncbi:unnamed protein product [Bemisia tabaci]|uniref:Uncharacterized protein n=1 Tax=Bemisia tabaci TaxID=7038 RepID=A0A9P0A8N6_BEMTA|nr:unnamed protein product [Bemisia tabaci]